MSGTRRLGVPGLDDLGRDLLNLPRWRVILSLSVPFFLAACYCAFAFAGLWPPAVVCVAILSFVTYGSISHDLVHRSLGLPRRLNDLLLTLVELLMLRSGRAYQLAHLQHHARYPDALDDPEGEAAHGSAWDAVWKGPLFVARLWLWAVRRFPRHRGRLVVEFAAVTVIWTGAVAVAVAGWSVVPLVFAVLCYLGSWLFPLATSYLPHTPEGATVLTQTRRFRGWVFRLLALDHLYHLEHHLYPAVPHQHWPELARRLDPYLDDSGIPPVRLWQ